jgi:comEA protein
VKRLDAVSIIALALSAGTLAAIATGAVGTQRAGATRPPSSPVVVNASGQEIMPLDSAVKTGESVGVILTGPTPAEPESPATAKSKPTESTTAAAGCVNINAADESALTALRGIGPALAARIVSYRNENGAFKRKEDLMNVKGIGPAKFAAAQGSICL